MAKRRNKSQHPPNGITSNKRKKLMLDMLSKQFRTAFAQQRWQDALNFAINAARLAPQQPGPLSDAAVCQIRMCNWDEAIALAQRAVAAGGTSFSIYDTLAHAFGAQHKMDEAGHWGRKALEKRAEIYTKEPPLLLPAPPLPPPPSPQTASKNVIAFSLFGANPRYCEAAVLNVEARSKIYPHWTCVFYVDDSVPSATLKRLQAPGSEIVFVNDALRKWPGPMWRFAAYDRPDLHRVIFRDADSIISERERVTVDEWIESDRQFHLIRDWSTHTELMLAGLWGTVSGALPPMRGLIDNFLHAPLQSRHFADQFFLRECVWPYAAKSLLQHDWLFGFAHARPHPQGPPSFDFHIGFNEGSVGFESSSSFPDGTEVFWELWENANAKDKQTKTRMICRYPATVERGVVRERLPAPYARRLNSDLSILLRRRDVPASQPGH